MKVRSLRITPYFSLAVFVMQFRMSADAFSDIVLEIILIYLAFAIARFSFDLRRAG